MSRPPHLHWLRYVLLALVFCGSLSAHDMRQVKALLDIRASDWTADLTIEAWSIYPDEGPHHPQANKQGEFAGKEWVATLTAEDITLMKKEADFFTHQAFLLHLQGELLPFTTTASSLETSQIFWTYTDKGQAKVQVRLQGPLPKNAQGALTFEWKDVFEEPVALQVTSKNAQGEETLSVMQVEINDLVKIAELSAQKVKQSRGTSLFGWIVHGFQHILPKGLDHVLFILGLFLLQPKLRPLLWQSSAFTLAHSITLGLVIGGYVSVSSKVVEPAIALSIAYVGLENLWVKKLSPWRTALVFALGLLHGMGFASVMLELAIPPGHLIKPLIGFNLGVECGQLAVIAMALAITWPLIRYAFYAKIRFVASLLIGLTGCYWTVERILG